MRSAAADERDGDYFGPALNRAARLMSAAHGAQVVLSSATPAVDIRVNADRGRYRRLILPARR